MSPPSLPPTLSPHPSLSLLYLYLRNLRLNLFSVTDSKRDFVIVVFRTLVSNSEFARVRPVHPSFGVVQCSILSVTLGFYFSFRIFVRRSFFLYKRSFVDIILAVDYKGSLWYRLSSFTFLTTFSLYFCWRLDLKVQGIFTGIFYEILFIFDYLK